MQHQGLACHQGCQRKVGEDLQGLQTRLRPVCAQMQECANRKSPVLTPLPHPTFLHAAYSVRVSCLPYLASSSDLNPYHLEAGSTDVSTAKLDTVNA